MIYLKLMAHSPHKGKLISLTLFRDTFSMRVRTYYNIILYAITQFKRTSLHDGVVNQTDWSDNKNDVETISLKITNSCIKRTLQARTPGGGGRRGRFPPPTPYVSFTFPLSLRPFSTREPEKRNEKIIFVFQISPLCVVVRKVRSYCCGRLWFEWSRLSWSHWLED